jgi:transposase
MPRTSGTDARWPLGSAWCPDSPAPGAKSGSAKITKRGDTYLRGLLTQGARSTLQSALLRAPDKRSRLQSWIVAVHDRAGCHKTLIAIANKHARILWAILAHGDQYNPDAWKRYATTAG